MSDPAVWRCADLAATHSDIPGYLPEIADLFAQAHTGPARGGVSIEVGTRAGGSALMFAELLLLLYPEGVGGPSLPMLHTIDPYGSKPYLGGDVNGLRLYGEDYWVAAKKLLAPYAHHTHWRMMSIPFLEQPPPYWWGGMEKQWFRGVTFAFLDGDHDSGTIRRELAALKSLMRPGGIVVVDNADVDPTTRAVLRNELDLGLEGRPFAVWRVP